MSSSVGSSILLATVVGLMEIRWKAGVIKECTRMQQECSQRAATSEGGDISLVDLRIPAKVGT